MLRGYESAVRRASKICDRFSVSQLGAGVSGRSKPARDGRMKTSHLEVGVLWGWVTAAVLGRWKTVLSGFVGFFRPCRSRPSIFPVGEI